MHAYKLYSIFYYTYQYFQAKLIIDIIISSKMLTFVVENNTFCALILDFRDSFCNHLQAKVTYAEMCESFYCMLASIH